VTTEGGRGADRWNIKHRIEYSSAYSIEPYERVSELVTFNAVDPETQSTGQALGYTENVRPIVNFPSVTTLNSVTWHEFLWYLKTLISTKSYGAETRIKGDTVNYIVGICAGFEEIITSLELNLELSNLDWQSNPIKITNEILEKYAEEASSVDVVKVLTPQEVKEVVDGIKKFEVTSEFIKEFSKKANDFHNKVGEKAK
jgi:CRISPR type I-D-associated protein Csc2